MSEVDDLKKRIAELQSKLDEENLRILAIDSEAESWKARGNEWKEKFQAQRQRIAELEAENLKLQTYLAGWHRYARYDNEMIRGIQENEAILRGEVE